MGFIKYVKPGCANREGYISGLASRNELIPIPISALAVPSLSILITRSIMMWARKPAPKSLIYSSGWVKRTLSYPTGTSRSNSKDRRESKNRQYAELTYGLAGNQLTNTVISSEDILGLACMCIGNKKYRTVSYHIENMI